MDYYSNEDGKYLKYFDSLLFTLAAGAFMSAIFVTMGKQFFVGKQTGLCIAAVLFAGILMMIGYFCSKQRFSILDLMADEVADSVGETPKLKVEAIADEEGETFNGKLKREILNKFINEKVYLSNDLTISMLAKELNTNRTYVSKILNQEFGETFNQLVKRYRIEHSTKLMLENKNKLFVDIATESGYTCEQSFYRNFKKIMGMTPKVWRDRNS